MSEQPRVVDKHGTEIRLSSYQKNELYRKAKEAREQLRDSMCTRRETRNPNEQNVNKMVHEMRNDARKVEYIKSMQAIGADPGDVDCERIRRK